MQTFREHNQERGVVGLVILGVLVLALVAAALFFVMRAQDKKDDVSTPRTDSSQNHTSGQSRLQINAQNTHRTADVLTFLGGISEFINNNNGNMPGGYENGAVVGMGDSISAPIKLEYYTTALVGMGAQPPLDVDTMRMVTGARCAEDGSTVAANKRAVAVQYMLASTTDGEFSAKCREM